MPRLQGKEADRLVTRIDPGVVSLVAELRGHERQAAERLERRKTRGEERKPLEPARAAITLALLLTDEELDSLEKGALEMEKQGAEVHGVLDVQELVPATSQTAAVPTLHGASVQG